MKKIIVSMTSYPGRIANVSKSIFFLLQHQTVTPDEIHLWLSDEQFPHHNTDLPNDLRLLINGNYVIVHYLPGNTYVHKRHEIFNIASPDDCVFFIDDDVKYNDHLIETVMATHELYPECIICYNNYHKHQYNGRHIIYSCTNTTPGPHINTFRWCGQSMIPASLYPKHILSPDYQYVRDCTSPISDECWFQPWIVFYDIPLYFLNFGWGADINPRNGKLSGLVSWTHMKDTDGYERRDKWLNAVLSAYQPILQKYRRLFNYG